MRRQTPETKYLRAWSCPEGRRETESLRKKKKLWCTKSLIATLMNHGVKIENRAMSNTPQLVKYRSFSCLFEYDNTDLNNNGRGNYPVLSYHPVPQGKRMLANSKIIVSFLATSMSRFLFYAYSGSRLSWGIWWLTSVCHGIGKSYGAIFWLNQPPGAHYLFIQISEVDWWSRQCMGSLQSLGGAENSQPVTGILTFVVQNAKNVSPATNLIEITCHMYYSFQKYRYFVVQRMAKWPDWCMLPNHSSSW